MLEETISYKMIQLEQQIVKGKRCLFVHDIKVNQESHLKLEIANEIIVKASINTGLCYDVTELCRKCSELER